MGTVHDVKPDSNCGFSSVMENLIAEGLLDRKCTLTDFRRGMRDFDSNLRNTGTQIEDRIVDHKYSRLRASRNWVKKGIQTKNQL